MQIALKSPEWTAEQFPWPGMDPSTSTAVMNNDIESLNEQQQECQFKADVLGLNTDCCRICKHLSEVESNTKAKQVAQASWVRGQIHQGRVQVVEPFMQSNCMVKAGETIASLSHWWGKFSQNAAAVSGTCLKVFSCDCHKFARMSDDAMNSMFEMLQQFASSDPKSSAAIILVTTVASKKRLTGLAGGCWLRQRRDRFQEESNI